MAITKQDSKPITIGKLTDMAITGKKVRSSKLAFPMTLRISKGQFILVWEGTTTLHADIIEGKFLLAKLNSGEWFVDEG